MRTSGTVTAAGGCLSEIPVGVGGDFRVTIRRAIIVGVHSRDGTWNSNALLYGSSQL